MSEIYLSAAKLEKRFGTRVLFSIPRLTVKRGDHIGLIGPNGAGKTTLLHMLSDPDCAKRYVPVHGSEQFGRPEAPLDAKAAGAFHVRDKSGRVTLSGGEEARLRLAAAGFGKGRLLFLDEPTANLDMEGVEVFLEKLREADAFILVSHDRSLIQRVCNQIWSLENGSLTVFPGGYEAFEQDRARLRTQGEKDYQRYTREKAHLESAQAGMKEKAGKVKKAPSRMGNSEARLHKRSAGEKSERLEKAKKALESRLERLEKVERPQEERAVYLDFSLTDPPQSPIIASGAGLTFGYDAPLFENASFTLPRGAKTALMGPNGSGKTTLMRLLAAGHPSLRVTPKAKIGRLYQDLSSIDPEKTVLENAEANSVQSPTTVRTVLTRLLFPRERFGQPAKSLSGGEKVKLAFAQLILSDRNVLLLDEPTNYLDLPSLAALEGLIRSYPGTVLFVSHDQEFVKAAATRLIILENRRLTAFEGTYEQYTAPPVQDTGLMLTQLQMRMARLTAAISSAPKKDKERLEEEYRECLKDYRKMNR